MTKAHMHGYRRQLDELAARLRDEVSSLRGEVITASPLEASECAEHEAEEGRSRAVLTHEESILDEVSAALDRMEQGTFGQCTACGKAISHQRLDTVPYSRFCVGCAERHEGGVT